MKSKLPQIFVAVAGALAIQFGATVRAEPLFAVDTSNQIFRVDTDEPEVVIAQATISGLQTGETILGMDFRPANAQLYALGSTGRLYTVVPGTGVATVVGSGPLTPALTGTAVGFDFNPVPDRIRIVTDADENIRLNPDTGALVSTDVALTYDAGDTNTGANPNIGCVAYNNNFAGAASTTLFGVDIDLDTIVLQGSEGGAPSSPNAGLLFTDGKLAVNASGNCGMDFSGISGSGYLSLIANGTSTASLYEVDFGTGHGHAQLGTIGAGTGIVDIAVPFEETVVPTIAVTRPTSSTVRTRSKSITVQGTASDNIGVQEVQMRTRGASRSSFKTVSTTTTFEKKFSLRKGTTRIDIRAYDIYGNVSATTTIVVVRR